MLRSLLLAAALLCAPLHAADPGGFWKGAVDVPGTKLAIEVDLQNGEPWSGTITIPIQGIRDFALSDIKVDGRKVEFAMDGIPGRPHFAGALAEDGDTISGTLKQGAQEMPFSIRRAGKNKKTTSKVPAKGVPGEGAAGEWMGLLNAGVANLRLALHVTKTKDGALEATMDSLDQNALGMAIDEISLDGKKFAFRINAIQGGFKGTMAADGRAIEGTWTQLGNELPLTFLRLEAAFTLNRPQEPTPPLPYKRSEVTFRNEADRITLAGTYLVPEGGGPFPTVVFVTGSGPQDRDESLMGHRPFLVIADYLARRGIASLRYDDRGFGSSEGAHMASTVEDFASDAAAGVAFVAAQPATNVNAIGIIGHSEGGLHGPMVATDNKDLDFLVLLAPPGEPLDQLVARQSVDMLRLKGVDEDLVKRLTAHQEEDFALLKDQSLSGADLKEKFRALSKERLKGFTEEELQAVGYSEAQVEQSISTSTTPWFRSLLVEDPRVHLREVKIPVLALFGGRDVQVSATINAREVEKALAASGNKDFTVHTFPALNHLFQHCETGSMEEYATIEETFAPKALKTIGDWIVERF